jgi:hypothetical protein
MGSVDGMGVPTKLLDVKVIPNSREYRLGWDRVFGGDCLVLRYDDDIGAWRDFDRVVERVYAGVGSCGDSE